jgi:electron transport complex protein RnfB
MSDEIYLRLREFLDQFPLGYPATESGVELKILEKLFTPREAQICLRLTPFPETVRQIADRTGEPTDTLAAELEAMAGKGLVFRLTRKEETLYRAAPFMIGLYEYSVRRLDPELAGLYREYYRGAYQDEMGRSGVPGFKVLPLSEKIDAEIAFYPFTRLEANVRGARRIAVTECICRKEAMLAGHGCGRLLESCLSFGAAADYYIASGIGREINAEEAMRIIKEADGQGLVHAASNVKHLSNICNCCPCCCASLKGIVEKGRPKNEFLNALFEAKVDGEECSACGECVAVCPVGAISLDKYAEINQGKCLGCGLCANACSMKCIELNLREKTDEPFGRMLDLGLAILEGKRKKRGPT